MFTYDRIDEYQLEITSYCNAACPQCHRNLKGYGINPYMPLKHMSREVIDNAFTTELCQRLRQIFFCGAYGEPIMHPKFLDILKDFKRKNPNLKLYIHTNGGVHDTEYWAEMASILNNNDVIDFNIDGLEDTLHIYRRNVQYQKVIENAKSFIGNGGNANWNFIVFKHNEHQVDLARTIASEVGFKNIFFRKTGRFFNNESLEKINFYPVYSSKNTIDYVLEPTSLPEFQNKSVDYMPILKQQYNEIGDYFKNVEIQCDSLRGKKVAINMEGIVLPCNFLNHNIYDVRMHESAIPFSNKLSKVNGVSQVQDFLNNYDIDKLNINHSSLENIFESTFWNDINASFTNEKRLYTCAFTCGSKFKKVWDQGGSGT
jgi:MoaA/NifB/PqqE/SkfB family radical SAM enzyme